MSTSENQTSGDSITAFLASDHERLRKLWDDTLAALHREDFATVHARSAEFIAGLHRHIRMEEQILFPAIDAKTGMRDAGPTYAMRMEHRQIEEVLDGLKPLLTVAERWTGIQAVEGQPIDPSALFNSHDQKEEMVLYPMADQVIGADEVKALIVRMRTEVDSPQTVASGSAASH